jgi:hypothetical protein
MYKIIFPKNKKYLKNKNNIKNNIKLIIFY